MPDAIRSGHAAMYDEVPDYDYGSCQVQTAEPNKVGGGQLVERVASAVAGTREDRIASASEEDDWLEGECGLQANPRHRLEG
jgi:hypothetical protein